MNESDIRKVSVAKDAGGSLVMDSTYFPMVFVTWGGALSVELADRYYEFREPLTKYGNATGTKLIVITDLSEMQVPNAVVRKYIGTKAAAVDAEYSCLYEYISVIPNAVLRGVTTALSWFIGDKGIPSRHVSSMDVAIAQALKTYKELGIKCPEPPTNYKSPTA